MVALGILRCGCPWNTWDQFAECGCPWNLWMWMSLEYDGCGCPWNTMNTMGILRCGCPWNTRYYVDVLGIRRCGCPWNTRYYVDVLGIRERGRRERANGTVAPVGFKSDMRQHFRNVYNLLLPIAKRRNRILKPLNAPFSHRFVHRRIRSRRRWPLYQCRL